MATTESRVPIEAVGVRVFTIPTDAPESDGTLMWDSTTLVLVSISAGGETGMGYSYTDASAAYLIVGKLASVVEGLDALDIATAWSAMMASIRNLGQSGLAATAVSAIDNALWDLKGKLLAVPIARLLGRTRPRIRIYGSGGFTSYDDRRLALQFGGWAEKEIFAAKMKIGRDLRADPGRMRVARNAIGSAMELFIDANGALSRKKALAIAETATEFGVTWFEEPVTSNDKNGLRLIRDRAPAGMAITTGEYGFTLADFRALVDAGAVDVLQADATRCGGITGFMKVAALAEFFELPLSSHCAPALHLHPCLAAPKAVHMEWFHDHVRIEQLLFEGVPVPEVGYVTDNETSGMGLILRESDAVGFEIGQI